MTTRCGMARGIATRSFYFSLNLCFCLLFIPNIINMEYIHIKIIAQIKIQKLIHGLFVKNKLKPANTEDTDNIFLTNKMLAPHLLN